MIQDKDQGAVFRCPECGLRYPNKELARKCEAWCREHQSCNIEIIKHAISGSGSEQAR